MGLFDKFIQKKFCDVCGEEIGLFGNNKLSDANVCDKCMKRKSPWIHFGKDRTLAEFKEHLEYREDNAEALASFEPTKTIDTAYNIYLNEESGDFVVTNDTKWREKNPDIFNLADVTAVEVDTVKSRSEEKTKDKEGHFVSYNPPHYEYTYKFFVDIHMNHRYVNEVRFCVDNSGAKIKAVGDSEPNTAANAGFREAQRKATSVKIELNKAKRALETRKAQADKPKEKVICPVCGGTTVPDASGCCEWCGSPVG